MVKPATAGMGALGGAASGASAGSAFGPWGALIGGVAGGALGFATSSDDDPRTATGTQIDPNDPRFRFGERGGVGEGAGFDAAAAYAGSREAPTTNYNQANGDYAMSLAARQQQQGLANRLTGILDGTGPATQAQLQMAQGNRDAIAAGQQMAASARGTNALIQARSANVGAVIGGQRAAEDAGMLRAREEAQARGELAGLLGGMRTQDMGSRAESAGQSQFLTQTEMQQRGINDSQQLGLYGLGNDARESQLRANVQLAQGNQGAVNANGQFNAGQQSDADQRGRAAQAGLFNSLGQFGAAASNAGKANQKPTNAPASNPSQASNGGYGSNPYVEGGGPPPKVPNDGRTQSNGGEWGLY